MARVHELHRVREHSRLTQLTKLVSSLDIRAAAVSFGFDAARTAVTAFADDTVNRRDHERQLERIAATRSAEESLEWHRALVQVALHNELSTRARDLTNSPFFDTADAVRELVVEATGGGKRPALLIAPFYHEEAGVHEKPPGFQVALRQSWLTARWHDDLVPLAGLVDRPLHRLDVDVRAVQQVLRDLPVVLVHGQVQEGGRVWPSLAAWNLLPDTGSSSLHLTFPHLPLAQSGDAAAVRALGDQLGRMFALTVGNLGDWFHLLRYKRAPRVHNLLTEGEEPERAVLATSAADSYDVLMTAGRLDTDWAQIRQARILAEGGLPDIAGRMARTTLDELARTRIEDATDRMRLLCELLGVFALLGNHEDRARVEALHEEAARKRLDDLHGWGEHK
ncbi:hypothetical protein ACWD01_35710 [Streptomyces sp. NPDC002835]